VVYLGGKVSEDDVNRATFAAIFFCMGIWAFEAQMVIIRVYFALGDTRTPTRVALWMIGLNFLLNLTLVWFLQEGGIALATTLAATIQGGILLWILRRRLGDLGARPLLTGAGVSILVTIVMVECGDLLLLVPAPWEPHGILIADPATRVHVRLLTALVKLPLLVCCCATIYIGLMRFLGAPEVAELPLVGRFMRPRRRPPAAAH